MGSGMLTELAIKLSANSIELKKGLDQAKGDLNSFKNDITSKIGGVTKAFGAIGVGIAAAVGVFKTFEGVIKSTGATSDMLEKTLTQTTFATDALFRSIATGDFSNLITNMEDAIKKGGEYAEIMDDLEDKTRSAKIIESEYRLEISKLKVDLKSTSDDDKRQSILKQIVQKEKEIGEIKANNAKIEKEANVQRLADEAKVSVAQMETFLKSYNASDALREKATKYNQYSEQFKHLGSDVTAWKANGDKEFVTRDELNNTPEEVKIYAAMLTQYGKAADTTIDAAVESTVKFNNSLQEVQDNIVKATAMLEKLNQKEIKADSKRADVDTGTALSGLGLGESFKAKPKAFQVSSKNLSGIIAPLNLPPIKIDVSTEGAKTKITELGDSLKSVEFIAGQFSTALTGVSDAFINMADSGKLAFKGLVTSMLDGIRKAIIGELALALASQIRANMKWGLAGLALAGVGITGVMAMFKKLPAFADGGMVYGDTIARVGEYSGASSNPEVIAPLDKLKNIIGSQSMGGQVTFEIDGMKLVGILDKQNKKMSIY